MGPMMKYVMMIAVLFTMMNTVGAGEIRSNSDLYIYRFGDNTEDVSRQADAVWNDPELQVLSKRFAGFYYFDVNDRQNDRYFRHYQVDRLPTLLVIDKTTGKVCKWGQGVMTKVQIKQFLSVVEVSDKPVEVISFGALVVVGLIILLIMMILKGGNG